MTNLFYRLSYVISLPLFLLFTLTNSEKAANKPDNENYKIEGTLRGVKSNWIYLAHYDTAQKMVKLDSAEVINEKFKFSGTVSKPEYCYLGMGYVNKQGKRQGLILQGTFILDKGTLTINCHKDSISNLKATGTQGQNEFNVFKEKSAPINLLMNSVYGKILDAEKKKDKLLISSLKKKQSSYMVSIKNLVINQAKTYPNSLVSAIIAKEHIYAMDAESLTTIYTLFSDEVKNSAYGSKINTKMLAENRTALGKIAPVFALPNQTGKVVSLTDYKGKITLVDFWASWCGPCRAENPTLIKAYEQYKSKGFDILAVSMDGDKAAWLKAINEDKLPWTQISDLKGTKSELKILYGITSIPFNLLLDKEGKVIARNLRGTDVQNELANYLK